MSTVTEPQVGTDLVHRPREVMDPATGELLELADKTPEQLAHAVDRLRELKSRIDEATSIISRECLARMDSEGQWTIHLAGGGTISGTSQEAATTYDAKALDAALEQLVLEGKITRGAKLRAVGPSMKLEVKKGGVKALEKVSEEVAAAIATAEVKKPRGNVKVELPHAD